MLPGNATGIFTMSEEQQLPSNHLSNSFLVGAKRRMRLPAISEQTPSLSLHTNMSYLSELKRGRERMSDTR
jgi:hypothetical protein